MSQEIIGWEINCETQEQTPIYSSLEYEAKIAQIKQDEENVAKEAEAKAKEKAALLAKLGITEDEAKLLLG